MREALTAVPYCGPAPLPGELSGAWNLDPWLIAGLGAAALGSVVVPRGPDRGGSRLCLALGLLVLAVAFVSPLCALASALFSARVAHHLLLVSVAAPLLALAVPASGRRAGTRLLALVPAQIAALWLWHAPAPYAAALSSDAVYWLMETTLLASAVLMWRELLARDTPALCAGLAHLAVVVPMGLLGALITFAPVPLYAAHLASTGPFGLSALEDQQLAGLLMWVPAILPNIAAALTCLLRVVRQGETVVGGAARAPVAGGAARAPVVRGAARA